MKILIAEDDKVSRRVLETQLIRWGHDVVAVDNGSAAWEILESDGSPRLAVLDWMMPGMDGVEICENVRKKNGSAYVYVIMLTAKGQTKDLVAGLGAGADDYVTKPYDPQELRSRLLIGERILTLESELQSKVQEIAEALEHVKQLQGLLPICMYCNKIRDDTNSWQRLETYIEEHSEAMFTHSLCSDCLKKHHPEEA